MKYRHKRAQYSTIIAGVGLSAVGMTAVWSYSLLSLHAAWLIGITLVTALFYAIDKAQAKAQRNQRIPEVTLHILSVLGGGVGALFGILGLRHKSNFERHPAFILVALLATIVHLLFFWWRFS